MRRRSALALLAAAPLVLAALASPAKGQEYIPINPSPDRLEEGIRFDDIVVLQHEDGTLQEVVRCGTPWPEPIEQFGLPVVPDTSADCGSSTNPLPGYDPGQAFLIDVWVHVIRNAAGTSGDIPIAELYDQVAVLNEDFRGIPGSLGAPGADARFFFRLKGYDFWNNNTWFGDNGTYWTTIHAEPNAAEYHPASVMNIYTNNAGGNLGYVPFLPHTSPGSVGTTVDRVVILHSAFGRDRGFNPYDKGRTATHEIGHYLGLAHTFQGGCALGTAPSCYSNGDWICDTPAESSPNFSVCPPSIVNSCAAQPGNDPIENYMDYSEDLCMDSFTTEQMRRMRCTILHRRVNLGQPILFYDDWETGNTNAWDATSTI